MHEGTHQRGCWHTECIKPPGVSSLHRHTGRETGESMQATTGRDVCAYALGVGGWWGVVFLDITPEPLTKITALLKEQSGACALGPSASQELFPALTLWNESCNLVVCQQQLHPSYD